MCHVLNNISTAGLVLITKEISEGQSDTVIGKDIPVTGRGGL
jgi:hypothetical protein